jgi:hypothetical protein
MRHEFPSVPGCKWLVSLAESTGHSAVSLSYHFLNPIRFTTLATVKQIERWHFMRVLPANGVSVRRNAVQAAELSACQ